MINNRNLKNNLLIAIPLTYQDITNDSGTGTIVEFVTAGGRTIFLEKKNKVTEKKNKVIDRNG